MKTIQAYRFALDLTASQERGVLAHAGAARVAHNWALARVKAVMDQRAAERSYGVAGRELTPSLSWSLPGLRKAWNTAKPEVAPWWSECSKEAFNTGLDGSGSRAEELVRLPHRQASWTAGRVPPVQVPPPDHADRAVHHRRDPGRTGPQACRAAPAGPAEAARVRPQTGPPPRRGHGTDHVRDRAA